MIENSSTTDAVLSHEGRLELGQIEQMLRCRLGHRVRDLRIPAEPHGMIICGSCDSYYDKQMAQHIVRELSDAAVADNRIVVNSDSNARAPTPSISAILVVSRRYRGTAPTEPLASSGAVKHQTLGEGESAMTATVSELQVDHKQWLRDIEAWTFYLDSWQKQIGSLTRSTITCSQWSNNTPTTSRSSTTRSNRFATGWSSTNGRRSKPRAGRARDGIRQEPRGQRGPARRTLQDARTVKTNAAHAHDRLGSQA